MVSSTNTIDDLSPPAYERAPASWQGAPKMPPRYSGGRLIGTGGMGEVWSFRDEVLGRAVAVKVLTRKHRAHAFEREARIQARLSHPSVVPIHDIGEDDGRPYLVMTFIAGETLATILDRDRAGRASLEGEPNRRQLLSAFVRVCQALAYAHAHAVIHRDLKPENIMLGELGEVYVLDWGIAQVDDQRQLGTIGTAPRRAGTLRFMAPEQIELVEKIDHRADIYALGAILFEILTLERLHLGESESDLTASVLGGVDVRARVAASNAVVPPELEAVCRRATATSPAARYADATELIAEIERFLDGERDEAARQVLADDLVARARAQMGTGGDRKAVVRDVGRALGLAPGHPGAADVLRRALADGVEAMPEEVTVQIAVDDRTERRKGAVIAVIGMLAWLALFGAGVGLGIREPGAFLAFVLCVAVAMGAALQRAIWGGATRLAGVIAAVAGAGALMVLTRLAGPFMLAPVIAAALMPVFAFDRERHRRWLFATYALAVSLPVAAELLGWIEPTTVVQADTIVIHARMAAFSPTWSPVLLTLASVAALAVSHVAAGRTWHAIKQHREERVRAAWQLDQVLPDASSTTGEREPSLRTK